MRDRYIREALKPYIDGRGKLNLTLMADLMGVFEHGLEDRNRDYEKFEMRYEMAKLEAKVDALISLLGVKVEEPNHELTLKKSGKAVVVTPKYPEFPKIK